MSETMRVRIKTNFGPYKVGQIFDWAKGMARLFVRRGVVEEIIEQATEPEPPLEQAAQKPTPRRRLEK